VASKDKHVNFIHDGLGQHDWDFDNQQPRQDPRYAETVEIVYLHCLWCPRTRWTEMDEYGKWVGNHHYGPKHYKAHDNGARISRAVYRLMAIGRKVPRDAE